MDKNDQVSHRKALSDDVLRKIGPNVLLFQAIERLLKLLIANHHADGTTIDFVERRAKRAEKNRDADDGQADQAVWRCHPVRCR